MTGCPGWCCGHADGLPTHTSPIRRAGPFAVQLIRLTTGGDVVHLTYLGPEPGAVPSVAYPVEDAEGLPTIFSRVVPPRPDLAAAITACVQAARYETDLQRSLRRDRVPALSRLADEQPEFLAVVTP